MKVVLIFVPPGGGEADYQLRFELPSVPQAGDYISIMRDGAGGTETFIVRRTIWDLTYPKTESFAAKDGEHGTTKNIWVECEFARGFHMTENHKRACNSYEARGYKIPEHDNTAY
jgi:hypothetical protein